MKGLSHIILSLETSGTVALADIASSLKKEGKPVISLAAGEPDFDTPQHIKDACIEALNKGFTKYAPSRGYPEVRQCIAELLAKDKNLVYDSAREILITHGAKQGILTCLLACLNPKDEVLIPSPRWVSYSEAVKMVGAKPVYIKTNERFQLDFEALEKSISSKTKLMILNSPNNPTGQIVPKKDIQRIAELAQQNDFLILSDEIYEKIYYQEKKPTSIATLGIKDKTIIVNGWSKTYSMTGFRLGWIAAPEEIMNQMIKIQQHSVTAACSFSQLGGLAALRDPRSEIAVKKMVTEFKKRRDRLTSELSDIPELEGVKPQGAFYYWIKLNLPKPLSCYEFCQRLLEEKYVVVVPGSAFGSEGNNYIRMSFAASLENILDSLDRIKEFIKSL
ncbi:MAG: pyridoxal phosphate-dependent aminotransferase [Candidatus Hodarchaeota archaeon]